MNHQSGITMQKPIGLLIVDDEDNITRSLQRIFRPLHYRVFCANSGAEGIKRLESDDIAIVISDMRMPVMNGTQFLQQVAEHWPQTVRIILTGYEDTQNVIKAINTGDVFRYISKPWETDNLLSVVAEAEKKYWQKSHYQSAITQSNELKSYNEQLHQERLQAEKLTEAKSRFLAMMSHEIRSPLNSVIAMNALLLDSNLSTEQRELAKIAHDGGQALLGLINDILDFSKIEAGKLQLNQQWFKLLDVLESTVELMATQTTNKGIELVNVIDPNIPSELFGDPVRIQQILINIISNGIKFTEQGGIILRVMSAKEGVNISVEDTGIGIPEDRQENIFDEFVQADNSDSRSYGGTGLGLSICKQLIEMMEGKITLSSQPGAGSHFHLSLPLASKPSILPSKRVKHQHLVSIDSQNPVLVQALKEQLTLFGYTAKSIDEAADHHQYKECSFLVDIIDINKAAESYKTNINHYLSRNHIETEEPWTLVGLLPNDGLVQLEHLKKKGFSKLLRKPTRLNNLLKYINYSDGEALSYTLNHSQEEKAISSKQHDVIQQIQPLLLVEDSPANQAVVKAILKDKPYHIDIANNGEEAVEKAKIKPYSVILMDLAMPLMDGLSATRHIRAESGPNQTTAIIAMTANAYAEDKQRCLDAGMDDYLSKPVNLRQFITCLNQWGDKGTSSPENQPAPTPPTSHGQYFDSTILSQLSRDVSPEALPKILKLFIDESEKRIPAMETFYQQQAWQQLGDEAHALKSGSGNFGATLLQEKSEAIETAVREKRHKTIHQEMPTLASLCKNTIEELRVYCATQLSPIKA